MPALAARGRTGIEHAPARPAQQPGCRQLRRGILHGHEAFGESGQVVDGGRFGELHRTVDRVERSGHQPGFLQPLHILRGRHPGCVHAQPHRRTRVVRGENRLRVPRPVALYRIDQPLRVIVNRLRRLGHRGGNILAQEAAHHGIQQACELGPPQQSRRLDGLRHDGVVGNAGLRQLVEADGEQRVDHAVLRFQRPVEKPPDPELQVPVAPQGPVAKKAQQCAVLLADPAFVLRQCRVE